MKKWFAIIHVLVLSYLNSFGQNESKFYNRKGQLIADTTFSISKSQLKKFKSVEDTLTKQIIPGGRFWQLGFEDFNYTGNIIISFKLAGTDTLQELKIEKPARMMSFCEVHLLRALKQIHIPPMKIAYQEKNKRYYLALLTQMNPAPYLQKSKTYINDGWITYMYSNRNLPNILEDTAINKWIDSVAKLLHGRWADYLNRIYNYAKGDWYWTYLHNKKYSTTGNPNTDTFSVSRGYYPRGTIVYDGGGPTHFSYFPGSKMMVCDDNEKFYLRGKSSFIYKVNEYWGMGGGGCFDATILTLTDTIYKGNKETYVRSPVDSSKYFVFLNHLDGGFPTNHLVGKFIIGDMKKEFIKSKDCPDGVLIASTQLSNIGNYYPLHKDSTVYIFIKNDFNLSFHKGDTVLLNTEPRYLYDESIHKYLVYAFVNQYYPFKQSQIEDMVSFRSNLEYSIAKAWRRPSFFHRLFHHSQKSQVYYNPVFKYMKKQNLMHTY